MRVPNQQLFAVLSVLVVVLITAALYYAGLSGTFVLDDTPNLAVITQLPPDPQWRDFWYAANSGTAGVLGRPLSLLSFLLQYQSWPHPFQFKLVNLLLHLVNGALLALMCRLLSKQISAQVQAHSPWQLSVLATALVVFIWLAHPLQVSTVFYVVQRMTELTTVFTLLGINLYLAGRLAMQQQQLPRGLALMVTGLVLGGVLAVLSKENGVLLLPYLAVLEFTLLADPADKPALVKSRRLLVYLPTLIGALAFLVYVPVALQGYELKPYTFSERVFTQFPVLLTYLANAALLMPGYLGLFHDDFPLVTGMWQPWYAVPATLLVLAVLVLAVARRKQAPLLAFAVLWFLTGHALESTVLPLELYFEHRNYLPLFGPVLALVVKVQQLLQGQTPQLRQAARAVAALALVWMCLLTLQQSRLWGDPAAFALASVAAHPDSLRAQSTLVETLTRAGQVQAAFDYHLSTIAPEQPRISAYVRWLEFRCLLPGSALPGVDVLAQQARNSGHDFSTISLLNNLTFGIIQNRCPQGPVQELEIVLANLLANPAYAISAADLVQMQAFLAAGRGDFAAAAGLAADSFARREDVRVAFYRITWLLRSGQRALALREFETVATDFSTDIASSADLGTRYRYLQQELGVANSQAN